MSVSDLLKDLPSRNSENFTKINIDNHHRSNSAKKSTYLTTKDIPSDQVIVTEKANILLRYLHQQWNKKAVKKRAGEADTQEEVPGKKARLDAQEDVATPGPSRRGGNQSAAVSPTAGTSGRSVAAGGNLTSVMSRPLTAASSSASSSGLGVSGSRGGYASTTPSGPPPPYDPSASNRFSNLM